MPATNKGTGAAPEEDGALGAEEGVAGGAVALEPAAAPVAEDAEVGPKAGAVFPDTVEAEADPAVDGALGAIEGAADDAGANFAVEPAAVSEAEDAALKAGTA